MTSVAVIIPFRDRGRDPLRAHNLDTVLDWWCLSPWKATLVDDGRAGDQQFNRSAAYNRGIELHPDADVFVFTESDMLIPYGQIEGAITLATASPGLVVPFTEYRYLDPDQSTRVRSGQWPFTIQPERIRDGGSSIGAINVVSRETLDLVGGYCELTDGNWYDDDIMRHAFEVCAGPTCWVDGPAVHLYHLPGWKGPHLTPEDRAATRRNKQLWHQVQQIDSATLLRELLHP